MSHGDSKSPRDRIFVPSFQHRAWLGSVSLTPSGGKAESAEWGPEPRCVAQSQPPPEAQRG